MPTDPVTPGDFEIYCEWGLAGLRHLAPVCDVLIIVDVLSFSTSVDIAVSRGAVIYPYPYKDERLDSFALSMDAEIADSRRGSLYSLSPSSLLDVPHGKRLVLPSPNGSTLSREATGPLVLTACLRNARAVAHYINNAGRRIGLVPAGERWGDGSLRPALEDCLGVGAVISHLEGIFSPEALAARAFFLQACEDLPAVLLACASGRELVEKGRSQDVHLAAALDCSQAVPILVNGAYHAWNGPGASY